ncbi:YlbD family protein [Anoxybacillus sp.]|uniref:YlbD family protein n=1 Tax=Anoxybacillus sp. TaxID=1872573 RepID=UPI0026175DC3|nr:YlbD family protein [uncultured Anoxybacillus sp.]
MSIEQFKQFVKKHPKMIEEVRQGKKTWKELYNDWYVFGEEDEMWDAYKSTDERQEQSALIQKLVTQLKHLDVNELQTYVTNVQQVITSIQEVVRQMQQTNTKDPFSFRKD